MKLNGIDVSAYQGKIDWKKLHTDFAIIRAGFGKFSFQMDTYFRNNTECAWKAGIPLGVYWYTYAESPSEAAQEANICLRIIEPYRKKITLPVFYDIEYEPAILALSNAQRTELCLAFLTEIEKAGFRPALYCSLDFWQNKLDQSRLTRFPLWIAQYDSKRCGCTAPNLIAWQYTSKGKISGINGKVDLNKGCASLISRPCQKNGWRLEQDDWYWYCKGRKRTGWLLDRGRWYYLDSDGRMLTGIHQIGSETFYFNSEKEKALPFGACVITNDRGSIL